MQHLEILLVIVSAGYFLLNRHINKNLNKSFLISFLVIILSFHLIFDGYRWQMIPAYTIWLIAVITALRQYTTKPSNLLRIFKTAGLVIIIFLAIALPSLLPVFEMPEPTGPYRVGTNDIFLMLDREEVITEDETDSRSIMIKAWYPSNEKGDKMDPYIDKAGRYGFAQKYGLPSDAFNYLDNVKTHVYRNNKMADEIFPVLIFSHGYNSKANGYYALLSEIVSHGYIVFAVNHTYESTGSTFPDGSLKYFNYTYASEVESGTWEMISPVKEAFENNMSFKERHPIVKQALSTYFVRDIVERWAMDIVDVVNELEAWNEKGFFKGKLNVSKVGVFGHSRGGGAAGESLLRDSRIKAGANVDGVQWGQIVDTVFQQPFLFLAADWPEDHENLNQHAYVNKSTSFFYEGMVHQSAHSNFMDIPFMIPARTLSQAGTIDPYLAIEITNKVVIDFFDKHLKNKEVNINMLNQEYEMLDMNIYKGDSVLTTTN